MHPPINTPLKTYPGQIIGYRKNGAPIRTFAGASGGNEPVTTNGTPPMPPGTTIAVPRPPEPQPTIASTTTNGQTFTADDIERARQQEKDKLYERINKMDDSLKQFQKDRDERIAEEARKRKEAEDAAEAARLENLTFAQKLEETSKTWEQRLQEMQGQISQRDALLEAERRYQGLQEYRNRRLAESTDNIMPELHSWVAGNTEQEIEDAISRATQTTEAILSQVTQAQQQAQYAQQQARQQARGTGVTAPPVGPMDNNPGYEQFSADDIRSMSMGDYAKNRARLLEAASQQMRGRGNA